MPKLILSSCDFGNPVSARCIRENLPCSMADCRVLFFPNEKATPDRIADGVYHRRLAAFGFAPDKVHVFDYFSAAAFTWPSVDAIYLSGGNTFGTMKRLRDSGADRIIAAYVRRGAVYIGGSAGAHIASADLTHVRKYDTDTCGLQELRGLGLFDGILICHYTAERQADNLALREQSTHPVFALGDEDVLVIA